MIQTHRQYGVPEPIVTVTIFMENYEGCSRVRTGAVGCAGLTPIAENRQLTDTEDIEKALRLGEYIKNGEFL